MAVNRHPIGPARVRLHMIPSGRRALSRAERAFLVQALTQVAYFLIVMVFLTSSDFVPGVPLRLRA